MKIVSGLGSIDDYIPLVKAGADEFFCGYVPYCWNEKYGILSPLNRREVLFYNVQIGTKSDLMILKNMVTQYGVPVKIAFNSLFYTETQYPLLEQIMRECVEVGFNTFIIADPALMLYVRQRKIPCNIHVSGETAEVNREMMKVFNEFGVSRFIFHRKNSIEDMKSCVEANRELGLEYEAFALNEYCHYTGAFCNSLHCDELCHMCKVPYQLGKIRNKNGRFDTVLKRNMEKNESELVEEWQEGYVTGSTGCGLCALNELKEAGVTHLKLVGRGNHTAYMEEDIRQMKKALKLLDETENVDEYKRRMKSEVLGGKCRGECYYW